MKLERKAKRKKSTLVRALCWIIGTIAVAITIGFVLFTYTPGRYKPVQPRITDEVNPYLHHLGQNFHNNIELDRPFEVIVDQEKLNQLIADGDMLGWDWPKSLNGVTFYTPMVVFNGNQIILMGKVDFAIPVVVSIIIAPEIDDKGFFYLNIKKIRAGALNITKLSRSIGGRIMAAQVQDLEYKQWLLDLSGAFLENVPYEPIFPIPPREKQIKLTYLEISDGKLVIKFEPAGSLE